MPVFTKGHTIAAASTARYLLNFDNRLYTIPAARPQRVPLNNTVI